MKLYFGLSSIPELEPLSRSERRRAWFATNGILRHDRNSIMVSLVFIGYIITCVIVDRLINLDFLGVIIGIGIGGFVYNQIMVRIKRPYLQQYLSNGESVDSSGSAKQAHPAGIGPTKTDLYLT